MYNIRCQRWRLIRASILRARFTPAMALCFRNERRIGLIEAKSGNEGVAQVQIHTNSPRRKYVFVLTFILPSHKATVRDIWDGGSWHCRRFFGRDKVNEDGLGYNPFKSYWEGSSFLRVIKIRVISKFLRIVLF